MLTSLSLAILIVSVVFIVLCTVVVALRIQARRVKQLSVQADDYVIFAALVVNIALCASEIYGSVAKWSGRPLSEMSPGDKVSFQKLVYGSFFMAQLALTLVKVSVILFYRRIFVSKGFQATANVMIAIVICWFVSFFFADLFSAWPIRGHWNRKVYHPTLNYNALLVATGAIAITLDVAILCMPIYPVSKLRLVYKRKLMVIGIFWLGLFCVISSAVRLYYIHAYTAFKGNPNALFSSQLNNITIWSIVESCMSVITACLPTYGPLLREGRTRTINSFGTFVSTALSTPSRWLLAGLGTSSHSLNKGHNTSQDSQINLTHGSHSRLGGLGSTPKTYVSSTPIALGDLEAQQGNLHGIKVDKSFGTQDQA